MVEGDACRYVKKDCELGRVGVDENIVVGDVYVAEVCSGEMVDGDWLEEFYFSIARFFEDEHAIGGRGGAVESCLGDGAG